MRLLQTLLFACAVAGCAPNSGRTEYGDDYDATRGTGTATVSWDVGKQRPRSPSEDEVRSLQNAPMSPHSDD